MIEHLVLQGEEGETKKRELEGCIFNEDNLRKSYLGGDKESSVAKAISAATGGAFVERGKRSRLKPFGSLFGGGEEKLGGEDGCGEEGEESTEDDTSEIDAVLDMCKQRLGMSDGGSKLSPAANAV